MRYFMEISYLGARFHGWQRQPNALGVQQCLEEALCRLQRTETPLTGAGRTDTGVNARRMFAHFDVDSLRLPPQRTAASLNTMCGPDIAVRRVFPVAQEAHARFSATSRTYRYFVHHGKNPFADPLSWRAPMPLDVDAMNEAADLLPDYDDFTSFAKLHSDAKTNICRLRKALWSPCLTVDGAPGLMFEITADRFLRNMVRAVVGTLVDVGRGKLSISGFRRVVECRNRGGAGTSMPPEPLFLWDVEYPEGIVPEF